MEINIPPALVLGCNTQHGINVLSDWIEEQTGITPDFDGLSHDKYYTYLYTYLHYWETNRGFESYGSTDGNGFGGGYNYSRGIGGNGFGKGFGYGITPFFYDVNQNDGDGHGDGSGYGYGDGSGDSNF